MAKVLVTDTYLTNIADAIRDKNGSTAKYKPSAMANAISAISTSGGSSGGVDLDSVETLLVDFYYDSDLITLADGIIYQTKRLIVS